jgi:hypothetical protein
LARLARVAALGDDPWDPAEAVQPLLHGRLVAGEERRFICGRLHRSSTAATIPANSSLPTFIGRPIE